METFSGIQHKRKIFQFFSVLLLLYWKIVMREKEEQDPASQLLVSMFKMNDL